MKIHRFLQALILTAVLVLGSSNLWAQEAKNLDLADFIRTEDLYGVSSFPYDTPTFPLGDIWGWSYNGEEYALICLASKSVAGSGLAMVKVTNLNNVTHIKTIKRGNGSAAQNGPFDVKVFGNYAYVCQDNRDNYFVDLVMALNNPTDPSAGVTDFQTAVGTRIHNL